MNKAVCNSSPIIALSSIKSLNLLTELFDEIYIPEAVLTEVTKHTGTLLIGRIELLSLVEKNIIKLYQIKNAAAVHQLYGKLHFGELEVIMAAKELSIPSVILDDFSARKLAETFLLNPVGTLGILLLAKQEGIGPELLKGFNGERGKQVPCGRSGGHQSPSGSACSMEGIIFGKK